jgi:hypothetical protein
MNTRFQVKSTSQSRTARANSALLLRISQANFERTAANEWTL